MSAVKPSSAVPWALALDALLVLSNLFLSNYLTRAMGETIRGAWYDENPEAARTLGLAMLATFVAHAVGAYLKRRPMHARLAAERDSEKEGEEDNARRRVAAREKRATAMMSLAEKWPHLSKGGALWRHGNFIVALLFLHCTLSMLVMASIGALLDVQLNDWRFCVPFFALFVPTILFARALTPPRDPARRTWLARPWVETVANAGLFSYALINQLFWGALTVEHTPPLLSLTELPARAVAAYVIIVPATLMYLFAPRVLFLAEELEDPRTRLSMKIAVASVAFRWVVGPGVWRGLWAS